MELKDKAVQVCDILDTVYPDAKCSLEYDEPYQLMIATRLSAQCTDARVNIVTKDLFREFPTLDSQRSKMRSSPAASTALRQRASRRCVSVCAMYTAERCRTIWTIC